MKSNAKDIQPYVGEPDIERLKAVLKGEPVDRVPNIENLIEDEHVTRVLGRQVGNTFATAGDPAKGADDVDAAARPMWPKDFIELNQVIGQDANARRPVRVLLKAICPR